MTNNIHLPSFDTVRRTIDTMRNENKEWGIIHDSYDQLYGFGVIPNFVTKEDWIEIVKEQEDESYRSEHIEKSKIDTTIISQDEDNDVVVPEDPRSAWQLYRNKLIEDGWREGAVKNLEKSTLGILKKLNRDTSESGPVKGLVIGKVQSGKTASMAALMAMASDWGWNTFIVLSGMIENLRAQTQNRLINDLNHTGNKTWISLPKLSRFTDPGHRLQALKFEDTASQRYLNVCLKNKTRLENLIYWLESDKNKLKQMKILVIDDEADQGSVNTKKSEEERAKINELIIRLVEVGSESGNRPKSMNYISYTATPYSNFLNESSKESLYPRNFIGMLTESNEYFGPKQIFGIEGSEEHNGMDIIRNISEADLDEIKNLQDGETQKIPESLKQSVCWFLCTVSVMRYYKYKKPISMLVHTSQKQDHHAKVATAIDSWIKSVNDKTLLQLCRKLYSNENHTFDISSFRESNKDYPITDAELNDYPNFSLLEEEILEMKNEISHIKMDQEGELKYHKGIHLCIDNCANNGINEEDLHIRLAYPTKESLAQLEKAPAFIVVGGSTLSRGLTIEGLVSTYFLRASTAADSLMQMGRWFGYRKGYEMFPRIWMTFDTYEKFCFLAAIEQELREELREFAIGNKSPAEYGPRVKNSPKVSWLRITAKNKMQNAEEIDMDFTGSSIQTIHFENKEDILKSNIEVTENFLGNLGSDPRVTELSAKSSLVYEGISFDKIKDKFLLKMIFNQRSRVFNQISSFCEWYEKVQNEIGFEDWNVIIAGSGEVVEYNESTDLTNKWNLNHFLVGKVNRSAKKSSINYSKDVVNIGVLRGPNDLFADIKDPDFLDDQIRSVKSKDIKETRERYGLGNVPQLLIYRIKKDSITKSKTDNKKDGRINLDFKEDIIGVYINIPGSASSRPHAKALRVRIDGTEEDNE